MLQDFDIKMKVSILLSLLLRLFKKIIALFSCLQHNTI